MIKKINSFLAIISAEFFLERTVNILANPSTGSLNQCGGLKDPHHFILINVKSGIRIRVKSFGSATMV